MKPRNVIVMFECRNAIPARQIEELVLEALETAAPFVSPVERPKANVIRNRRCLDPAANGPAVKPAPKAAKKATKKPATKKPARKLVAPARKQVR